MPYTLDDYLRIIRGAESGGDDNARNPYSTASGRYQFTQGTWQSLGFNWSDRFNANKQEQAIRLLTNQNASYLSRFGFGPSFANLYAAHFLGPGDAVKALGAPAGTPLQNLIDPRSINSNPFLRGMTAGDFRNWLTRKTGPGGLSNSGSPLSNNSWSGQAGAGARTWSSEAGIGARMSPVEIDPQAAANIATAFAAGGPPAAAAAAMAEVVSGATEGVGSATTDFLTWLKELFSINTATRFISVFVGVGLIIIALIYLTKTDRIVVEAAKTAANVTPLGKGLSKLA